MSIVEFIRKYLFALGIAETDIEEYGSKVIFTAAGTVLLELDEGATHDVFAEAIAQVRDGSLSPFALLDEAFPDGHHHALFRTAVLRTLIDTTIPLADALDGASRTALQALIAEAATV